MYHYQIHGLKIASDFPLEGAYPVPAFPLDACDAWIHEGPIDKRISEEEDGEEGPYYTGYSAHLSWIRATGHGSFFIPGPHEVIYSLKEGYDPLVITGVLLCFCLGALAIYHRRVALHGSGILWGNRAVLISGESGTGKSTLAEALIREGGVFMADDMVVLTFDETTVWANPAFPQQKLCHDAAVFWKIDFDTLIPLPENEGARGKKYALRLKGDQFCSSRQPLGTIIHLRVDENIETGFIRKVSGSEALSLVLDNLYKRRAYDDIGMSKEQVAGCIRAAGQVNIYQLVRPPRSMSLEEELRLVRQAIGDAT